MRFERHSMFSALCVCFAVLFAAGCGGGDATTDASAPAAQPTTPNTSADTSLVSNGSGASDGSGTPASGSGSAVLPPLSSGGDDVLGATGGGLETFFSPKATISDTESADSGATSSSSGTDTMIGAYGSGFAPMGDSGDTSADSTSYSSTKTYTTARILVDGKTYKLKKNAVFPSDTQQFTLRKITSGSVIIELTAGEFSDGSTGFELTTGSTRKFTNQSEGVSYTLKLIETS